MMSATLCFLLGWWRWCVLWVMEAKIIEYTTLVFVYCWVTCQLPVADLEALALHEGSISMALKNSAIPSWHFLFLVLLLLFVFFVNLFLLGSLILHFLFRL
ncbi:hypothetical protein SAY86_016165 [Trapa natans]|uniref:Uncharacterized protein n=1 Tax=Trapa natans TaxID=22666 RepID=A0AAN7LFK7_TRANT|nr:hypothetical protein SAY86_016165 [Trapa natans]